MHLSHAHHTSRQHNMVPNMLVITISSRSSSWLPVKGPYLYALVPALLILLAVVSCVWRRIVHEMMKMQGITERVRAPSSARSEAWLDSHKHQSNYTMNTPNYFYLIISHQISTLPHSSRAKFARSLTSPALATLHAFPCIFEASRYSPRKQ